MPIDIKILVARLTTMKVLLVDDEYYMRKVVRTLLLSIGVTKIFEAPDGPSGLEKIRTVAPDVVILDWGMPGLNGFGFVRMVRTPATFPYPDVPIIMLTGHSERSRVIEAVKLGVNEFLVKPVSSKSLKDRLLSVLAKPRVAMQDRKNPVPTPSKLVAAVHADNDRAIANLVMLD